LVVIHERFLAHDAIERMDTDVRPKEIHEAEVCDDALLGIAELCA
jgi:hypothetical protein